MFSGTAAGERLQGEPVVGDTARWLVAAGLYGGEDEGTQTVIIKPQDPGIETNLLVHTDRRVYYIRLVSRPSDYVARVAFHYPDDEASAWKMKMSAKPATATPAAYEPKILPAILEADKFNFGYLITGGDEHIRPVRVYDAQGKTFMQMPPSMAHREAPVLLVIDEDGKPVMSNYPRPAGHVHSGPALRQGAPGHWAWEKAKARGNHTPEQRLNHNATRRHRTHTGSSVTRRYRHSPRSPGCFACLQTRDDSRCCAGRFPSWHTHLRYVRGPQQRRAQG